MPLLFVAALCAAACAGCRRATPAVVASPTPPGGRIGSLSIIEGNPAAKNVLAAKPSDRPGFIDSIYRLKPDRRLLYAVAEVHRVLSGKEEGPLSVRFDHPGWVIRFENGEVGRLPEIPTFEDGQTLLSAWVAAEIARHGIPRASASGSPDLSEIEKTIDGGPTERTMAALVRLNERWKKNPGDVQAMRLACRGVIWLQLASFDRLQLTDPLAGRALALLAIAERLGRNEMSREKALLADHMGYEAAARRIAAVLPETDAVRPFVGGDLPGLRRIAEQSGDSMAQYLFLLRLAERRDAKPWTEWISHSAWKDDRGIAVLSASLGLDDFGSFLETAIELRGVAFAEVAVAPSRFPSETAPRATPLGIEAHLTEFEKLLAERASKIDGRLLDADSVVAFYRANLYSSMYGQARYLFDVISLDQNAAQYGQSIVNPPSGTPSELKDWILDRVSLRAGSPSAPERIAQDLANFRYLGLAGPARIRSSNLMALRSSEDPLQRTPIRGFFEGLDTRPQGLIEAAYAARESLDDLVRMRRYLTPAVALAPGRLGWNRVELLRRDRDAAGLRKVLDETDLDARTRNRALALLSRFAAVDIGFIESRYKQLISADAMDTVPLSDGVAALQWRHELSKAERLFDYWLEARGKDRPRDLAWAEVMAMRSQFLRQHGRVEEAWRVIEPAIESGKADCLAEAAEVLAARGKLDEAREMAERNRARYPDTGEVSALVAEMLWRQKKYFEAADVLQNSRAQIRPYEWRTTLGNRFVWGLGKATDAEVESAYSEVANRGFDPLQVAQLATAIGGTGRHELAARLLSKMRTTPRYRLPLFLMAYEELVRSGGESKATDWFREHVPDPDFSIAETAFRDRQYALLWNLYPDPSRFSKPNQLALLRAASLIMARKEDGEKWASLKDYFQKASTADPLVVYGRFWTGSLSRDAVLALWTNPENGCSIGWVLGLDAARHDRYEEASDWFQISTDAGEANFLPATYSLAILRDWSSGDRFLTSLEPGAPLDPEKTASLGR